MLVACNVDVQAQRQQTDKLDRGLVAVKTAKGVFCSWRITADEYYDVTYNIYRDGTKLNTAPLSVSNYLDASGTSSSSYAVEAVVKGVAQTKSAAATPLTSNYKEIKMDHGSLTATFVPNDATAADLDGDGELELIIKFDNRNPGTDDCYTIIEAYKMSGKRLWWINCGRNMGDFQNNEINIAAYDWDGDGKAECVMRAADGTVLHMSDGTTQTIGDASKNYRPTESGQWFVHDGAEYLLYLDGLTAKPYQVLDYPLVRLEPGEGSLETQWGDGYGHRSSKYFFGAPYFDGRKPSIFLARGIYTRHKMIAYDVDPATHKLTERWKWTCSTAGSPWYGQGYHNYVVADVDWDGRDEIVFGSMTIDDNGKGLATTGLGHGDSQHVCDFDPYRHGQEFFGCNEDHPGNNLSDATTRKILYRYSAGKDDGRCAIGNFSNDFPGAQGLSARDPGLISSVTCQALEGATRTGLTDNMRLYWDGDLCEECFNYSNGKNTEGAVYKYGKGAIATFSGSMTNNDTKGTPCLQADLFGDWREEVMMRTADNNVRIYTTTTETKWRNYTLWHDHQYRNAIVWQMNGYNQAPNVSYFLGELEGITVAPPSLTMQGRTEVANNGSITTALNDKAVIACETGDMAISVADGAAPYIFFDNAPSWVQGTDVNGASGKNPTINYTYYTHTLTGGAFGGAMRLVKQGDGTLVLPAVTQTYTGNTDVWAGTLKFDGTMQGSRVWLNRHTTLSTNGGVFKKAVQADYNATIQLGTASAAGSITADSLLLGFGSRVEIDLFSDGLQADKVNASVLKIEKKVWNNGPQYNTPVIYLVSHSAAGSSKLTAGKYLIGEVGKIEGNIADVILEGLTYQKSALTYEDGKLYIVITDYEAANLTWKGGESSVWNSDNTANFVAEGGTASVVFVPGSDVLFNDDALVTDIQVEGNVAPASVTFDNSSKDFVLSGDSIIGDVILHKKGTGSLTVNSVNHLSKVNVNAGKLSVSNLANNQGTDWGALGNVNTRINLSDGATLELGGGLITDQVITISGGEATIEVPKSNTATLNKGILAGGSSSVLTKTGGGTLTLGAGNTFSKLVVNGGILNASESDNVTALPSTVVLQGGSLYDPSSEYTYTTNKANFVVPEGSEASLYLDSRCNYTGTLTGQGTLNVYAAGVRNYLNGNWSDFEGTVVPGVQKRGTNYDPVFYFNNTYGLPKATLKMNSGVSINNNGKNFPLGKVTGSGTLAGSGSYIFGTDGGDLTMSTSCTSSIIKKGAGIMRVVTAGKITGSIIVEEGGFYFSGITTGALFNDTKPITGNGSSVLLGQAYLTSITINSGSTLMPRATLSETVAGTIIATGTVAVNEGGTLDMLLSASKQSKLQGKWVSVKGILKVTLAEGYTPAAGDSFTLWEATNSFSGTPTLDLPSLPNNLTWDTSELLAKKGVLKVMAGTGIDAIAADATVQCEVYTTNGQKVAQFEAPKNKVMENLQTVSSDHRTLVVRMVSGNRMEVKKVIR